MLYPTITLCSIPYTLCRSTTTFSQMIELWKNVGVMSWQAVFAFSSSLLPPRNCRICFPKLDIHGWSSYPTFFRWLSGIKRTSARFRSGSDFKNTLTQKGLDLRPQLTQDDASTSKRGIRGDLVHPLQHTLQWVPNGQFTTRNIISGSLHWWVIDDRTSVTWTSWLSPLTR